jgi:hypothetical protein
MPSTALATRRRRPENVALAEHPRQSPRMVEFRRLADAPPHGVVREFVDFLLQNKKWWLAPIVMAILLVGLMIVLGSSGAGPFIYSLY